MLSSALLASKEVDIKILLRIYRDCLIIIIAVAYVLNNYGIIGETIKHVGNYVGHSYGFVNPNTLGQIIMSISMTILLSIEGCTKRIMSLICILSALIVWYITLCKTSVIILLLIPVFYYFFINIGHTILSKIFAMLPLFGLLFSLLLMFYYGPSTGDTTFESRFSIPFLLYDDPGLTLFGHWHLRLPIDNCFFYIFIRYGIVPGMCLFLFYSRYLFRIVHLKDCLILTLSFCWFLLGFMEKIPLHICFNFLLFYYFCDYHQRQKNG